MILPNALNFHSRNVSTPTITTSPYIQLTHTAPTDVSKKLSTPSPHGHQQKVSVFLLLKLIQLSLGSTSIKNSLGLHTLKFSKRNVLKLKIFKNVYHIVWETTTEEFFKFGRQAGKGGHELSCEYGGNVVDPMRCNFAVY
mgnify:CR=1 FL=1